MGRMMARQVEACCISRSVSVNGENQDEHIVLMDMRPVGVHRNPILDAIMKVRRDWPRSPVVWVNNSPYKIKVLQDNDQCTMLLQMSVRLFVGKNGKEHYKIVNKRMVMIRYRSM